MEADDVIIAENSKPMGRLVPIALHTKPRVPGLNQGAIWTGDDFDEPLPDEFWTGVA